MARIYTKWNPSYDSLPMSRTELKTGMALLLTTFSIPLIVLALNGLTKSGTLVIGDFVVMMGVLGFSVFLLVCGVRDFFYKRKIVIGIDTVTIQQRTITGSFEKKIPLQEYGAVCKLRLIIRGFQYFVLMLPHMDSRLEISLAMMKKDGAQLKELHTHFSELLNLQKYDGTEGV